jgi:hypothetical protein
VGSAGKYGLELLGNDTAINMFGCSKGVGLGSACERKLRVQGDSGGQVSMLGRGSIGSCEIKISYELCLILNG